MGLTHVHPVAVLRRLHGRHGDGTTTEARGDLAVVVDVHVETQDPERRGHLDLPPPGRDHGRSGPRSVDGALDALAAATNGEGCDTIRERCRRLILPSRCAWYRSRTARELPVASSACFTLHMRMPPERGIPILLADRKHHLEMFFLVDSRALVMSVGDLVRPPHCEFDMLRRLDVVLGRREVHTSGSQDSAWAKILQQGNTHEKGVLDRYRSEFGRAAVVSAPRPRDLTSSSLEDAWTQTLQALHSNVDVVHQALIFDGSMLGYADFLVRQSDDAWRVEDAKLTRANAFEAKMQVAAYSAVLGAAGVRLGPTASIAVGDGTSYRVDLDEFVPAFVAARARVDRTMRTHRSATAPVAWTDDVERCGRCSSCRREIEAHRDVLLVHGVRRDERDLLFTAGIRSIEHLAVAQPPAVPDLPQQQLRLLQRQAALQLQVGPLPNVPASEVYRPELLGRVPPADPGDLFLSFASQARAEDEEDDEPDHLFTVTTVGDGGVSFWGDDHAEEADAFRRFLERLGTRRAEYPGMHVYHYSPVDRPHLGDLAARAGFGRGEVDRLHASGVLVDLYSVLVDSIRVGVPDHSLREIARLVDPDAADSLSTSDVRADRAEYRMLLLQGDDLAAGQLRSRIERENRERCVLTRRLRDHLLDVARAHDVVAGSVSPPRRRVGTAALSSSSTSDDFTSAVLDYHGLEESVFWRAHERRRHRHSSEWARRVRGAASIEEYLVEQEWAPGARGGVSRTLRLRITAAPGTVLRVGDRLFAVYDGRPVWPDPSTSPAARSVSDVDVVEIGDGEVLIRERLPKDVPPWAPAPSALAPGRPPRTSSLRTAVDQWANSLLRGVESSAADDLVHRRGSRTTTGALSVVEDLLGRVDVRASLIESIESLDRSFVAVQGPPGSGKTTIGAQVIAELVSRGYRIGVVAQSHAVVEHFLDQVVAQGASADRVGKAPKVSGAHRFTPISRTAWRTFAREHQDGYVLGGTAWDFTNASRVPREGFDLLVIDEAGQFGVVNAIAVAQSARNLLLLGDPQQLPQVSQASHRAKADSSALGWLLDGEAVLQQRFGYFLDCTWRMHPALTRGVSDLSYDNALGTHAPAAQRLLADVAPGLHVRTVAHLGSTDASVEEAREVVRITREVLGKPWRRSERAHALPLAEQDVIVVAPYNAQVECIRSELAGAGLHSIEVGTVDRFQGREAAVAIYSATVSNLALRPQAADFVLGRNRLNVAISRAQWAAFIVHAPRLIDYVPRNEKDAAALSRFLRLLEFAVHPGIGADGSDRSTAP